MTKAIEYIGVSKDFGSGKDMVEAIRDVSFNIPDKNLTAVVGPSGCGKTTLLRMTAGLIKPSKGEILLHGTKVESPTPRVGLVFQSSYFGIIQEEKFIHGETEPEGRGFDAPKRDMVLGCRVLPSGPPFPFRNPRAGGRTGLCSFPHRRVERQNPALRVTRESAGRVGPEGPLGEKAPGQVCGNPRISARCRRSFRRLRYAR